MHCEAIGTPRTLEPVTLVLEYHYIAVYTYLDSLVLHEVKPYWADVRYYTHGTDIYIVTLVVSKEGFCLIIIPRIITRTSYALILNTKS